MKKMIIGYFRPCDLLTMSGTTLALVGIYLAINGHCTLATFCLLLCGICDGFDGVLARKHNYSKEEQTYGAELDSLSDVICFGLLPSVITLKLSSNIITLIICAFFMLCGVIRLAYFNMLHITEKGKKNIYVGMPITMSSIIYPIILFLIRFTNFSFAKYIMPGVLLILGLLYVIKIEYPKLDIPKITNKIMNKYVINFVLFPIFIVLACDIFFKAFNFPKNPFLYGVLSIVNHFLPFLLIVLFALALVCLLTSLFNDSKKAKVVLLILVTILMFANDIKFIIMGRPIVLSDINFVHGEGVDMMFKAFNIVNIWILRVIFKAIIMILFTILFVKIDKYHNFKFENKKKRWTTCAISIIFITFLFIHPASLNEPMTKYIYHISSEEMLTYQTNNDLFYEYGFLEGVILDNLSDELNKPKNYQKEEVKNIISNLSTKEDEKWQKANIVFLLSESFFDVRNISEVTFNKNLMSNIDRYQNNPNMLVTNLIVPTFGGSSANSEYEVLTSSPLAFQKPCLIPYDTYYTTKRSHTSPSIINELNNNGYHTMYITPWGPEEYHSRVTYDVFGADEQIYDFKGTMKGGYVSDESLMDEIINQLKTTSDGNYKFIMAASSQNHFPFHEKKYEKYDIEVTSSSLDEDTTNMIKSYAQGVYDADKALNYLYEQINELETPTVVVFFGDHLPYIIDSHGHDVILNSKYMKQEPIDIKTYTTKAVVLSNFEMKHDKMNYLNANYLGSYVINKMDLNISDYYRFVDETRKIVPAFNRNKVYENNQFIDKSKASATIQKAIQDYHKVEYKYFYDN